METLDFKFDAKASPEGVVEGYGSVFNVEDSVKDIVAPGAFKASIESRRPKMLWQHDPERPIGVWDEVREDDRGLYVKGRLALKTSQGAEVYALLQAGAIDGLSIGYRPVQSEPDGQGRRILKAIDLWEVSIVTFPANAHATIDAVKAAEMTEREFERLLLRESRLSRRVVGALMRHGWKGVVALSESSADLDELADALKRLAEVKKSMIEVSK